MDIDQWLQNTSAPEGEGLAARLGIPSFLQRANPEPVSPRHKRKRRRPSRDSSLLEDPVSRQDDAQTNSQAALQETSSCGGQSETSENSAFVSVSATPSTEPYRRRSRRKTRVDRYDPKPENSRKRRPGKSKTRKETKTRKQARRNKEKHGIGHVHTFHAKNVARDRLTLKPQKNAGLFKRGRASSPRRGRGCQVPDLCFSEMKFLQKPKEPSSEPCEATTARAVRKKRQEKVHDEQISTFFGVKRPSLSERDPNVQSTKKREKQRTSPHNSRREPDSLPRPNQKSAAFLSPAPLGEVQEGSTNGRAPRPTVEFPDRPFLGFGGIGNGPSSTSHYTWSNSGHHLSPVSAPLQPGLSGETAPAPEEPMGEQATHSSMSRPLSRGKTLSRTVFRNSGKGQEAAAIHHGQQASSKKSFETSAHSRPRTIDNTSKTPSEVKNDAKNPRNFKSASIGGEYGAAQDSSSSLSHLLHECEAAIANQPSVQISRQSRYGNIQDRHRAGKQMEQEESISEGLNQSRANKELRLPPLFRDPQLHNHDVANFKRHEGEIPVGRNISVDTEGMHNAPPYDDHFAEFDDSVDALWNSGRRQGYVDWHGESPRHRVIGHNENLSMVDELGGDNYETIEDEAVLEGFWKPNKLY